MAVPSLAEPVLNVGPPSAVIPGAVTWYTFPLYVKYVFVVTVVEAVQGVVFTTVIGSRDCSTCDP